MLIRFGDRILNTDDIASVEVGTAPRTLANHAALNVGHILVMTTQGQRFDVYQNEGPGYALLNTFLANPSNVTTLS